MNFQYYRERLTQAKSFDGNNVALIMKFFRNTAAVCLTASEEIAMTHGLSFLRTSQDHFACFLTAGQQSTGQPREAILLVATTALQERDVYRYMGQLDYAGIILRSVYIISRSCLANDVYSEVLRSRGDATVSSQQERVLGWVYHAATTDASDVHLSVSSNVDGAMEGKLEMRWDGMLHAHETLDSETAKSLIAVTYNNLSSGKSHGNYSPGERLYANITERLPPNVAGARIQCVPLDADGRYMVVRLLVRRDLSSQTLESLGYLHLQGDLIREIYATPYGQILTGGPVGSGKSTTVATCLTQILRECQGTKSITTIEDPVEYVLPGIKQQIIATSQNEEKRRQEVKDAIRGLVRLDNNVAMIGETRDLETASMALNAARAGMQIWSTVHSNQVDKIPDRLRNIGLSVADIYDDTVYIGLMCQRLVRQLCSHCKRPLDRRDHDQPWFQRLSGVLVPHEHGLFVPGDGCEACGMRKYKGRRVAAEIMKTNEDLMAVMMAHPQGEEGRRHWMQHYNGISMMAHALTMASMGETSPEEIERVLTHIDGRNLLNDRGLGSNEFVLSLVEEETVWRRDEKACDESRGQSPAALVA